MLTVCHELSSGAALIPEVGAMYGPNAVSETALIQRSLQQLPPDSVVMADAGFGIFTVAHQAAKAGHAFVLRMTQQRFKSLVRKAELTKSGDHCKVWSHAWKPSAKERKSHPDLPQGATLPVRLHQIVINEHLTLLLVTDLSDSSSLPGGRTDQRTSTPHELQTHMDDVQSIPAAGNVYRRSPLAREISHGSELRDSGQTA